MDSKPFYNVGSGTFYHPYWTNLDFVSDWYKDVQKNVVHVDLTQKGPLPIRPGAEVVYTSHTIEHIKDDAVQNLFNETYRVLKRGGYFRITTRPDADNEWRAMIEGDGPWFYWDHWYERPGTYEHLFNHPATSVPLEERWLHHVASQLAPNDKSPSAVKLNTYSLRKLFNEKSREELLDYLTGMCSFQPDRPGNRVSWWNFSKIENFLTIAGFKTIYRSGYGQSRCAILRNTTWFDNTHPQMSVYVEAIK